jgi:hypothetical protein
MKADILDDNMKELAGLKSPCPITRITSWQGRG